MAPAGPVVPVTSVGCHDVPPRHHSVTTVPEGTTPKGRFEPESSSIHDGDDGGKWCRYRLVSADGVILVMPGPRQLTGPPDLTPSGRPSGPADPSDEALRGLGGLW